MGLKRTKFPGVFRRESRRGRKFDRFTAKAYDPDQDSQQTWLGSFPTAAEARDAKAAFEDRKKTRSSLRSPRVVDYSEGWLEEHPRARSTNYNYGNSIRNFVGEFGDARLSELPRHEVRIWGLRAGETHLHATRAMLTDAVRDGFLTENPLANLGRPKQPGRAHQVPPSSADLLEILDIAKGLTESYGPLIRSLIAFGFGTMLRPGEICALRPEDLDWADNSIWVSRGIGSYGEVVTTKTKDRSRIAFTPLAQEAVRWFEDASSCPKDRVIGNSRGEPLRPERIAAWWVPVRSAFQAAHNRPEFGTFDFYLATRHAGASFMRNELGVRPDDIDMQLRHRDTSLRALYTHPNPALPISRILQVWPADLQTWVASRSP